MGSQRSRRVGIVKWRNPRRKVARPTIVNWRHPRREVAHAFRMYSRSLTRMYLRTTRWRVSLTLSLRSQSRRACGTSRRRLRRPFWERAKVAPSPSPGSGLQWNRNRLFSSG